MFWLIMTAQLSAPAPANPRWFTAHDVPIKELKPNVLGTVKYGLTVAPDGKIQDCRIELSSRNPQLDSHTCTVAKRRAKFRAARGTSGNPVYGVYRTGTNWWIGDGYPPTTTPIADLELTVVSLPSRTKSPTFIRVMFAVDTGGRPSSCVAENTKDHPSLVKVACDQLMKSFTAIPAKTAAGNPVESIQTGAVLFRKN